ncbi:MAG: hypothetical protein WCS01_13465 [bacterium]|jgi:hypothetical protein
MKWTSIALAATFVALVAQADFVTPLNEFPIGTNASGRITLIASNAVDGVTNYMAVLITDNGPRTYPVVLPPDKNPHDFVGKECFIEAVIEKDESTSGNRRFRITHIEVRNRKQM